jgi:hypothetical protein
MTKPQQIDKQLDASLQQRRPAPSRDFGAGLRARLLALHASEQRPARLWLLVGAYAGSGTLLLILAALGAVGNGPFGS